jgi:hypothetical protein
MIRGLVESSSPCREGLMYVLKDSAPDPVDRRLLVQLGDTSCQWGHPKVGKNW